MKITPTRCFTKCFTVGKAYTATPSPNCVADSQVFVIDDLGHKRIVSRSAIHETEKPYCQLKAIGASCPHLGMGEGVSYVAGHWLLVKE